MTDTQMNWLHILVKDRGSTFIVILKTFLEGKLILFSLWSGSTCKKMKSVICCDKYYCTNVLRIALRINLIFLFNWSLATFSFIHIEFTPVLPLCRLLSNVNLNRPGKHCNSLPVQAKHSNPKLPTVGLLASRFMCGINA